jgi:hypothetical protein
MNSQAVVLNKSEAIYQRARQAAESPRQPVEEVIVTTPAPELGAPLAEDKVLLEVGQQPAERGATDKARPVARSASAC